MPDSSTLLLGLLVSALFGLIGLWLLVRVLLSDSGALAPILFVILGLGTILVNIFSPRTLLDFDPNAYLASIDAVKGTEVWVRVSQVQVALFVLTCGAGIARGIRSGHPRLNRESVLLVLCGSLAFLPAAVSTWISGYGAISYREFLFPLFMITVLLNPQMDISRGIKAAKFTLLCFVYGSLLSMLIAPGWAYSSQPGLSLIGLNVRLFGLSNQPNGLGYIALAYLILAWHHQKEHALSGVHLLAAFAVLILSQSKTAWAAWALWMMAELTFFIFRRTALTTQSLSRWFLGALALAVLCVTVLLLFRADLMAAVLGPFSTLTGRTSVWEISYRTWLQNPLFGYGVNIWDVQFRLQYGYLQAGQAHNQFLQALGESGLVGLTGVLIYVGALTTLAAKYRRFSAGTSFAFVLVLLVRSLTEAPLRTYLLDGSFLVHSILFFVLVNAGYVLRALSNNGRDRTRELPEGVDARNRRPHYVT